MKLTPPDQHTDHAECEPFIRNFFRAEDIEVVVSTLPPIIATPYTEPGMRCPHGTTYWFEPTSEQRAQWTRDGVA